MGLLVSFFSTAKKKYKLTFSTKYLDALSNESSSNFGGQQRGRPGFHDQVPNIDTVPVTVPVVDFSKFMARVAQRFIPPPADDLAFPPAIVMKMDVRMQLEVSPLFTIANSLTIAPFARKTLPIRILRLRVVNTRP